MHHKGSWLLWVFTIWVTCIACSHRATPITSLDIQQWSELAITKKPDNFQSFVATVARHAKHRDVMRLHHHLAKSQPLTPLDWQVLMRLAGAYALGTESAAVEATLARLVELKTLASLPLDAPAWQQFDTFIAQFAKKAHLSLTRDDDNRYLILGLAGRDEPFSYYSYATVAPSERTLWLAQNHQSIPVYYLSRVRDRLYGRGVQFNKGAIASMLHAMKVVGEMGIPLQHGALFFIDKTYHDGQSELKQWADKLTPRRISLTARYPIVTSQKGRVKTTLSFEGYSENASAIVSSVQGGISPDAIAGEAQAIIRSDNPTLLEHRLNQELRAYAKQVSGDYRFNIEPVSGGVKLLAHGRAVNAALPKRGVNALQILLHFLATHQTALSLGQSPALQAAEVASHAVGVHSDGRALEINYSDQRYGHLTIVLTQIKTMGNRMQLIFDLRYPATVDAKWLRSELAMRWRSLKSKLKLPIEWQLEDQPARVTRDDHPWVDALMELYAQHDRNAFRPIHASALLIPPTLEQAVGFGPVMRHDAVRLQTDDEYITQKALRFNLQITTEMLLQLGKLTATTAITTPPNR